MEDYLLVTTLARRLIKTSRIFNLWGLIQLYINFHIIMGICENLPSVQNSENNATTEEGPFEDGSVIAFTCKSWYRGFGSRIYACRDGSWVGDYECLRRCEILEEPENGKIVGNPTYVVGTRLNFTCDSGYELEGFSSLMCRADGKWRPSDPPTCKPVDCGEFGNVDNGNIFQESLDGVMNDYGSVITISCDLGYVIQGSNSVTCNADGRWGAKPDCVRSSCGIHPATKTKCVDEMNLSDDGSVLTVLCKERSTSQSVTKVGSGTAICFDNQWDDLDMGCFCNCKIRLIPEVNKRTRMQERTKALNNALKEKTEKCMKNRKHANLLLDILVELEEDDTDSIRASVKSVHKIFSHFLDVGEMCVKKASAETTNEEKYKVWLQDRYKETVNRLLKLLQHDAQNIRVISLTTLLKFMQKEGKQPLTHSSEKSNNPVPLLRRILSSLISDYENSQPLIEKLQEYLVYDDVRYFMLKHIHRTCQGRERKGLYSDPFLENVFAVLENCCMPVTPADKPLSNFLSIVPAKDQKVSNVKEQKRVFTEAWVQFLQFKLPTSLYRKVLISLHDKVLPHMTNPLVLSDFLTVSYSIGGAISLLSLNSLFVLMHKHNLDYPDFYKNLYAMFEPTMFHAKYRSRFFNLSNLFLSSTHLPAYMVAAFAKRLARISLMAPVVALKVVIPFIYNLINRHPMCKQLIHRPDMEKEIVDDPFISDEPDPAKCRAIDSCLWELKTLQEHYYPDVVYSAKKMDHNLPDLEIDLSELLDIDIDEIFEKECSKKMKKVPITFEPPKGILSGRDDRLKLCWTL